MVDETLRSVLQAHEVAGLEEAVRWERAARDVQRMTSEQDTDLSPLLDRSLSDLSAEDLNDLRAAVGALLLGRGVHENWEPNTLGLECEHLIDRLSPWHWGKDV